MKKTMNYVNMIVNGVVAVVLGSMASAFIPEASWGYTAIWAVIALGAAAFVTGASRFGLYEIKEEEKANAIEWKQVNAYNVAAVDQAA